MIFVAAQHATSATCTLRDKQTRFSKRNKDKRKTKRNYPGFEFKPHQVNDSSQSNQETDQLVSETHYKKNRNFHRLEEKPMKIKEFPSARASQRKSL
jgi:hypothetical protein